MKHRRQLNRKDVEFEVRFAVGRIPQCVWVTIRGKDRIKSADAIERVVQAVVDRFDPLEVWREYDPAAVDFRNLSGRDPNWQG